MRPFSVGTEGGHCKGVSQPLFDVESLAETVTGSSFSSLFLLCDTRHWLTAASVPPALEESTESVGGKGKAEGRGWSPQPTREQATCVCT